MRAKGISKEGFQRLASYVKGQSDQDFADNNQNEIDWNKLVNNNESLEDYYDFIRENPDKVDWGTLSHYDFNTNYPFDKQFLIEFADYLDWDKIVVNSEIAEKDLLDSEIGERLDWEKVSMFQDMSPEFIRDHKDWLLWENLIQGKSDLPEELMKDVIYDLSPHDLDLLLSYHGRTYFPKFQSEIENLISEK